MPKKKTTRKPKTSRVPKTRACGEWTESGFFAFIRSNLRRMSMRWPPLRNAKKMARRPYEGPNKRQRWEYQCSDCQGWFMDKETAVDHIVPCGSIKCFEDIGPFVQRLLCEMDDLRVLCTKCHTRRHDDEASK